MSELMNASGIRKDSRWQLLTTASVLALLCLATGASKAKASDDDADRSIIWIDLGGQLERAEYGADLPAPPFAASVHAPLHSPVAVDRPPSYSHAAEGSIQLQPEGSDWIFSASLRYGRSNGKKDVHDQTNHRAHDYVPPFLDGYYTLDVGKLADITPAHRESHAIIDFQVGKDVGLGLFGSHGSSVFNAGIRFAQFNSDATTDIQAKPDVVFYNAVPSHAPKYAAVAHYHIYKFAAHTDNNFRAFGPSISWSAAAPFAGNKDAGEITLDLGANAALLFGRQKTVVHHQTTAQMFHQKYNPQTMPLYQRGADHTRSHSVTVPDLGGFAGLSFRYSNAKISFGYRGDFFFGALDTGIDTAKRTTIGFDGPFATISFGLP